MNAVAGSKVLKSERAGDRLYAEKDVRYFSEVRMDILSLIPSGTQSLLDIGCGTGGTAAFAKEHLKVREAVGIELHEPAAEVARTRLDRVIVADIEQSALDLPNDQFDCILCGDVLEHLQDPWALLIKLRRLLKPDGVLIASIPNIRHLVPLLKIIFDRLEYEPAGILDKTHLRFYTLHTIRQMFDETGYVIEDLRTNRSGGWKFALLTALSFGALRSFSVIQYVLVARKK